MSEWVIRSVSTWTRLEAGDNDDDCGFAYTHPMTAVSSAGGAGGAGGWVIRSVSTWTRLEAGDNDDDYGFSYTDTMVCVSL